MLGRLGFDSAAQDAKLLTGHALGLDTLGLAMHEQQAVDAAAAEKVAALLQRRMSGEPVGRIMGVRAFYGLDFALNPATLEPRPETELLVDMAIGALPPGGRLLDLGTGTGCIPIAILANRPDARGTATDLSKQALEAARANAVLHDVTDRLDLMQGDWFSALDDVEPAPAKFDLITSNPPYIASAVIETLAADVRDHDPLLALDGGPDGLVPYRIIAAGARERLVSGGNLLVEIGYDQGAVVSALLGEAGFTSIAVHKDLNGLDRVVSGHHV